MLLRSANLAGWKAGIDADPDLDATPDEEALFKEFARLAWNNGDMHALFDVFERAIEDGIIEAWDERKNHLLKQLNQILDEKG